MGHWTPTGVEPKDYDDDENPKYFRLAALLQLNSKLKSPTLVHQSPTLGITGEI